MGGRGASSSGGGGNATGQFQMQTQPPNTVNTQQQAQQANARTFDDTDNRPYHDLVGGKNYFQSQNLTIDQQLATINYLSPNPEAGSLYSMSQNMNYALAQGYNVITDGRNSYHNVIDRSALVLKANNY